MNLNLSSLLMILQLAGRETLLRALTIPEKQVRQWCQKTGADPVKAIAQRDQFAEQAVQFVEAIAEKGWVDPDFEGFVRIS